MAAFIFLVILYLAGGIAFVVTNCTVSAIDKRLDYHLPMMALHLLI